MSGIGADPVPVYAMGQAILTDVELIDATLGGKVDAFTSLVERYQSLICAVSYSATGDRALSEDVAQETFVAAWHGLSELREPSKLRSWLCGIARNLSSKALRRVGREIPGDAEAVINEVASSPSPLDDALEKESEQLVWTALQDVPETYREPLVLFYREDQSIKQVADALGLSENAVQQRLSRGRHHLKASVADLVQRTLERSKPSKGFAAGVVAAISVSAAGTAEAAAAPTASSASAGSVGSTLALAGGLLTMKLITKIAILAALVLLIAGTTLLVTERSRVDADEASTTATGARPSSTRPTHPGSQRAHLAFPNIDRDDDPAGSVRLEGQVIDLEDRPVADALVFLGSNPPTSTRSEADGSFSFDQRIGRRYQLWAHAGVLVSGPVFHQLSEHSDPVIIRVQEGIELHVTVVESQTGEPIPDALVRWTDEEALATSSDEDGLAILRGVMPGEHTLEVEAPGFAMKTESRSFPISPGMLIEHRVSLAPGVAVSGRVLDEEGHPIPQATVRIQEVNDTTRAARDLTTDNDGVFAIPAVTSGTYRCTATHENHAPTSTAPFTIGAASLADLEIVMPAGGVLAGRVVSSAGDPVPFADIRVLGASHRQTIADEDGSFRMTGVSPVELRILASTAEAASEILAVDLRETRKRTDIALVLTIEGEIAGVVVDESGEAIPEAQVIALPDFINGAPLEQMTVRGGVIANTDSAGAFTLRGLPAGAYEIRAARTQMRRDIFSVPAIRATTGDRAVRLILAEQGAIVAQLQFSDGTSPKRATVELGHQTALPVADGKVHVSDVAVGSYTVLLRGPDFPSEAITGVAVQAGETTNLGIITVPRGRTISGRVLDATGTPIAGAEVALARELLGDGKNLVSRIGEIEAQRAAMGLRRVKTGVDGTFRIPGVSAEELTIAAQEDTRGRSLPAKLPARATDEAVELVLAPFGALAGTVRANGIPQGDATLTISARGAPGNQSIMLTTGQDGSFDAEHIPAGAYDLQARLRSDPTQKEMSSTSIARARVQVEQGTRAQVDLDIELGEVKLSVETRVESDTRIDLAEGYLFAGIVNAKLTAELEEAGPSIKRSSAMAGNPLVFEQVSTGQFTVCALVINGNLFDRLFLDRLKKHAAQIPVYCQPVQVQPSPTTQSAVLHVKPMPPLPE